MPYIFSHFDHFYAAFFRPAKNRVRQKNGKNRYMTSRDVTTSEFHKISCMDILFVSKIELNCIDKTEIMNNCVFPVLVWE